MKRALIVIGILGAFIGAIFSFVYLGGASLLLGVTGQNVSDMPSFGDGFIGNRLPYFDLPDLVGNRVRSTDFADTPLIIVFWATWNTEAADEMHILDQYLADRTAQSDLVKIIAVNSQEERSIVSSFMNRGGYRVPTLLDAQGVASERYGIKSVPTFYFADRAGVIREIYTGMLSQPALMNKLENILQ